MLKVTRLENKNQFIIRVNDYIYFQSYNSLIASYNTITKELILFTDWDYSKTTLKHLYLFFDYYVSNKYLNDLWSKSNKKQYIQKLINENKIKYSNEY